MCLLRAPTNTAVFIRNRANVRLDVPVGDRSRAYLQLSFRVCYRWLFARAWWVSMEKALPQKQVPSRRGALRRLDTSMDTSPLQAGGRAR